MRKIITAAFLLFIPSTVLAQSAQPLPPLRIYDEGTKLNLRFKLNCVGTGITCSDDPTNKRTLITISSASGTVTSIVMGTGLSSTQSPLTTTGTMSIDQSFSPTWSGSHTFSNGITAGGAYSLSAALAIGTAQTAELTLANTSAAVVGTQQYSPGLSLLGNTWETTGPSSQVGGWFIQAQGVNAATASSNLAFYHNANNVLTQMLIIQTAKPNTITGIKIRPDTQTQGAFLYMDNNAGNGRLQLRYNANDGIDMNYFTADGINFNMTGSTRFTMTATELQPVTDVAVTLGDSTHRYTTGFFQDISAKHTSIGTAQTSGQGILITNTTAAANAAQQYSPLLELKGAAWDTSASEVTAWALQTRPIQAATPTQDLVFWSSINGGAYAEIAKLASVGSVASASAFIFNSSIGEIGTGADVIRFAPGSSVIQMTTNYPTTTTGFDYFTTYFESMQDKVATLGRSGHGWKRLWLTGTAAVSGDFAASAGFGATASFGTITGDDNHARFTVTASGGSEGASPTVTYTFHDGTFTTVPFCVSQIESTTDVVNTINLVAVTQSTSATALTMTYNGTPIDTKTYTIAFICIGG